MKYYTLIVLLLLGVSCHDYPKKESPIQPVKQQARSVLKERSLVSKSLTFTAYKTTKKIGVSGSFKEIITKNDVHKVSGTLPEALNKIEFEIPISSLSTNNPIRDSTVLVSFFKKIQNSKISGSFKGFQGKMGIAMVMLNFNGITQQLPVEFTSDQKTVRFNGLLDLSKWGALSALESINNSCFDLHKGPDGISKTWQEIKIEGQVSF